MFPWGPRWALFEFLGWAGVWGGLSGLAMTRIDEKSNLKVDYSNDVSNSKWGSQNSHSFIDQCCVGTPIPGFL